MYGLFINSYDYHEWHDLVAVSTDKENLVKKAEDGGHPLLKGVEQQAAKEEESTHFVIEKVEYI